MSETAPATPPKRRAPRRRGRDVPRPHRVNLALSDEEFAAIKAAARLADMTTGAWASDAAAAVARGEIVPLPTREKEHLRALMDAQTQVRSIGINLNQAARKLNMDEEAPELPTVIRLTERMLTRLDEAMVQVLGTRRGR
ncbi:mobilization protein MobC [Streptomyces sp. 846.5]|nr:plasmid mobilization relaxosome protein MobC [Streptomyces sp. 846.5]TDT93358.1 mobilization protein MobC [Streptomyces sp. 846.5]